MMEEEISTKKVNWAVMSAVLGFLLLWLLTSVKIVGTGKVGVVTQFGRVTGRELSEGINLAAPWPIQKVVRYDTRVQKEQVDAAAASKDLQDVHSTLALNYEVERGKVSEIHRSIGTNFKEKLVDPALQESFKASSAQFTASDLITKRPEIKNAALKVLTERLHKFGITVIDLSIVNFGFSDDFTKAIEAKQVAQQEAEKAAFNLERAKLDAKAQEVQKQTLSEQLLRKYAIDKWDGKLPTYLGSGTVFNIPLGN